MSRVATREYIDKLLQLIGSEGFSGITVPTKTIVSALGYIDNTQKWHSPREHRQIAAELRRQELVTVQKTAVSIQIQLTVKGIHRIQRAQIEAIDIRTPETWDDQWRMILFDIPARKAESRYILTSQLKRLGFVMVQRSMWVHPFPCFTEVAQLVQYANLQPFVTMAEISRIDDSSLRRLLVHYPNLRK